MTDIGSIKAKVELDSSRYSQSIKKIKNETKDVSRSAEKAKRSFNDLDTALSSLGAGATFVGLTAAIKATVNEATKLQMSMQGLIEVSKSLGKDVDAVTQAAQDMASKGFMTATESAEAYKNAMSMGLELNEATKLINALGDAAAYNRESHLGWGEAVVQAMRGIRQQESSLTDAAGVTTNLSIMYDRYAKQIGKSAAKLTEAEKVQAAYNGMLKDAALFAGNAESAMDGYQGSQARFNASIRESKAELGEAFLPILAETMEELTPIITQFAKWADENEDMVVKLTGTTLAVTGLVSVLTGLAFAFNTLRAAAIPLMGIMGPAGWLIVGLSVLVPTVLEASGAFDDLTGATERNAQKARDLASEFDELKVSLDNQKLSEDEAIEAKRRMVEIMQELNNVSPGVVADYKNQTLAINDMTRALELNRQAREMNFRAMTGDDTQTEGEKRSQNYLKNGLGLSESEKDKMRKYLGEVEEKEAKKNQLLSELDELEKSMGGGVKPKNPYNSSNANSSSSNNSNSSSSSSTYSKSPEQIATQRLNTEMRVLNHKRRMNEITDKQFLDSLKKKLDAYGKYSDLRMQLEEQILDTEQKIAQETAEAKAQSAEEKYQASSNWIKEETRRMELAGKTEKEITEMRLAAYGRMKSKYGDMAQHQATIDQNLHSERMKLIRIEEQAQEEALRAHEERLGEITESTLDSISEREKSELKSIRNRKEAELDSIEEREEAELDSLDNKLERTKEYYDDSIQSARDRKDRELRLIEEQERAELDSLSKRKEEIEGFYDDKIDDINEEERVKERKELLEEFEKYRLATSKDGRKKYEELQDRLAHMDREEQIRNLREEKDEQLRQLRDKESNVKDYYDEKEREIKDSFDYQIRKLQDEKDAEVKQLKERRDNLRDYYDDRQEQVKNHYDNMYDSTREHYSELKEAVKEYTEDTAEMEMLLQDDRITFFKQGNSTILSDIESFVKQYNAEIDKIKDKKTGVPKTGGGSSSGGSGSVPSGYDSKEDYVNDDNWHKGKTGQDYRDAFKERVERLKEIGVFHSGGVVGQSNFAMGDRLLPNEVVSILQKGEYVFQPRQLNDLLGAANSGTTNNYYAPLIQSGDTHLEDEADVSTYWRERELAAQRLMSGGER